MTIHIWASLMYCISVYMTLIYNLQDSTLLQIWEHSSAVFPLTLIWSLLFQKSRVCPLLVHLNYLHSHLTSRGNIFRMISFLWLLCLFVCPTRRSSKHWHVWYVIRKAESPLFFITWFLWPRKYCSLQKETVNLCGLYCIVLLWYCYMLPAKKEFQKLKSKKKILNSAI